MSLKDTFEVIPIDRVAVEEKVSRLNKRSIKKESKMQALKLALSMVDLTTLEGKDSEGIHLSSDVSAFFGNEDNENIIKSV